LNTEDRLLKEITEEPKAIEADIQELYRKVLDKVILFYNLLF